MPVCGKLDFLSALFTACSAVCVTGLSVIDPGTHLTAFGQIVLMILVQIGGAGIVAAGTFFIVLSGRRLSLANEFSVADAYGIDGVNGVRRLVVWVIVCMLACEFSGAVLLCRQGHDILWSAFHSVMSFCNAGFGLNSDSMAGCASEPVTLLCVSLLATLGGMGFFVIYNICTIKFWKRSIIKQGRLSLHTRVVIWSILAFVLVAFFVILAFEADGSLRSFSWKDKISVAFFQAVVPRTCGFTAVAVDDLHPAVRFFTELLMFVGAAPGSTAGGIKVTTFVVFLFTVVALCRGRREVVISKRTLKPEIVREALVITFMFILLMALSTMALLITEYGRPGYDFEKLFFEAVSAVSTSGLSFSGVTESLSIPGRIVMMVSMFLGRLGAITVVMSIAGDEAPEAIRYPQEDVMVG